mgnify:CR=1 FL=1
MIRNLVLFGLFFIYSGNIWCQEYAKGVTTVPQFENCKNVDKNNKENCFKSTLQEYLLSFYKEPKIVKQKNYEGEAFVLFEIDKKGFFNTIYVNAEYKSIKKALESAFDQMPQVEPAMYNGEPTYYQLRMPLNIPFNYKSYQSEKNPFIQVKQDTTKDELSSVKKEYDQINTDEYQGTEFRRPSRIPFSHELYNRFDQNLNVVGSNFHTATKSYRFNEVNPYYDFKNKTDQLKYKKESWLGKKLFNEHLVAFQTNQYWLTFDIATDLQLGRDSDADFNTTYNNTRAAYVQGGIGDNFTFYGSIFESQGRFAEYYNRFARSISPIDGWEAVVPGRGVAKAFKDEGFDYPVTEGYLGYEASDVFYFELGMGKNFIGDGYRSLFTSDNAAPQPYFKVDTEFWKIKYTNTWMSLRDTQSLTESGAYTTKFMATHFLSYNVSKKLNIGLFEAVLWENEANRGFDVSYLNPLIFYQMAEFSTGTEGGKALVGLSFKYKFSDKFNTYGQFLIDELATDDIASSNKSWRNKFGLQLGLKHYDLFSIENLNLQLEYNQVRPFTYSHNTQTLNFVHSGQSMAHLWGANFREFLTILRYNKNRIYGHAKFILGERGFEPEADSDPFFGSDLFGDEANRNADQGVNIGQGNRVNSYYGELELGYILNPMTNLKLFGRAIYRNFDATEDNARTFDNNTTWLSFGLRTDLFNRYYDY